MVIESIQITSFAALSGRAFELGNGINVLTGPNESGKSTVAAFLRFVLYGFSGRAERERYIGFTRDSIAGSLILRDGDNKRYRIERKANDARETCAVYDLDTGKRCFQGQVPGEVFFGIPSALFASTAFVGQADGGRFSGAAASEAVDNLLFSGDETVNTKRAMNKLEEMRIALLYKNKRGGSLYEKDRALSEADQRLSEAVEQNGEILALEASGAELSRKIEADEKTLSELTRQLEDYRVLEVRRRNQRLSALEADFLRDAGAVNAHHEAYTRNGFFPDGEYRDALRAAGAEIQRADSEVKRIEEDLDRLNEEIRKSREESERLDREEEEERARLTGKRNAALGAAILCCLFFLISAVVSAVVLMNGNTVLGLIFAAAALALLGGMIAGFVLSSRHAAEIRLLERGPVRQDARFEDRLERIGRELASARQDRADQKARLDALCAKWDITPTARAIGELNDVLGEEKRLQAAMERSRIAYVQMKTETETRNHASEIEDDGREAVLPADFDPKTAASRRDMLIKMIAAKRDKRHDTELRLAALKATAVSPAAVMETITALEYERNREKDRYEACVLAEEALNRAIETMRSSISPRLAESAGGLMRTVTAGRYEGLGVSPTFSLSFRPLTEDGDRVIREEDFMSAGTADAAYLCLRLALVSLICGEKTPPMIFDESFCRLDDERLSRMLRLLATDGRQVWLLTSVGREAALLERLGLPFQALSF